MIWKVLSISLVSVAALENDHVLESFDSEQLPANLLLRGANARIDGHTGAMQVDFEVSDWPNVCFRAPTGAWDWSSALGLAVDVFNPGDERILVSLRVDNEGADQASGAEFCITGRCVASPGVTTTLRVGFEPAERNPYWGMRGLPVLSAFGVGTHFDSSKVTAFQVYLSKPQDAHSLILDNIRLFGVDQNVENLIPVPFVDRFGQYMHAEWPGKVNDAAEFRGDEVIERLCDRPIQPVDRFGGWIDGPQLEATGWYRTERVRGKWWFVTPSGRLFFSLGMAGIGFGDGTFVSGREAWFDALPDPEAEPQLAYAIGQVSGALKGAEPIRGEGKTVNFYIANLVRKFGVDWLDEWSDRTSSRLTNWGFNSLGAWTHEAVRRSSDLPFVETIEVVGDFRRVEGARGYWGSMPDVYDARFAEAAERCVQSGVEYFATNRVCMGYFVDNELPWESLRVGVLACPTDQPCRIALIDQLQRSYSTIDELNAAWETSATDWNDLIIPPRRTEACKLDMDTFIRTFATRYFRTVHKVLRHYAPNQLYFGCRFAADPRPVLEACASFVDVITVDIYSASIPRKAYRGTQDLGKPVISGEFHFGALDRGMFYEGLLSAASQQDRAESFIRYVRSAIDNPNVVGCHWFQYVDQPLTGRWYDGENANIGFVTVADVPYPELIGAAQIASREMYERRYYGTEGAHD